MLRLLSLLSLQPKLSERRGGESISSDATAPASVFSLSAPEWVQMFAAVALDDLVQAFALDYRFTLFSWEASWC